MSRDSWKSMMVIFYFPKKNEFDTDQQIKYHFQIIAVSNLGGVVFKKKLSGFKSFN